MADDLSKRGKQDRTQINLHQEHEVHYWMKKLGVTRGQLAAAVERVGNSAEAVERELNNVRNRSGAA